MVRGSKRGPEQEVPEDGHDSLTTGKRRREAGREVVAGQDVMNVEAAQGDDEGQEPNRREVMAEVARRRAAHFAHFQAGDEEAEQNAHTGGSEARGLGPWSSAMELIEARGAAAEARQGKLSEAAKTGLGNLADDSVAWNPQRSPKLGARPAITVGPLFQACVALLVDHIEDVESLVGLPDVIKMKLAAAVCKARKLSPDIAKLFTEEGSDVLFPDCTQMTEDEMLSVLRPAISSRLERLDLNLCGRGFGDAIATAMSDGGSLRSLKVVSLGGAYRLTDEGLLRLLRAAPNLVELHLPQCSRIRGAVLERLPESTPNLRVLDLTDCRGISAGTLRSVLCSAVRLSGVEALSLDGISEVDDNLLTEVCVSLPKLSRLSVNFCALLSDDGVRGVAAGCGPRLTELKMDEAAKVTDAGLVSLADACANLQVLSLRRCHRVTDGGLAAVASRGMLRVLCVNKLHSVSNLTIKALVATCSDKLEEADFSWCRSVTEKALGLLADSCPRLRRITLFGCSQVEKDFLYGHSNSELQVIGATAQRTGEPEVVRLTLREDCE